MRVSQVRLGFSRPPTMMKSPQPPSMIWHSCDSIQLPPAAPSGPTQWSKIPESRAACFRGAQGPLAPLPFHDQVIVVKLVLRRQSAEFLARDLDHPVVDREDLGGIVVLMVVQIGVKSSQVLAVELEDRLPGSN